MEEELGEKQAWMKGNIFTTDSLILFEFQIIWIYFLFKK